MESKTVYGLTAIILLLMVILPFAYSIMTQEKLAIVEVKLEPENPTTKETVYVESIVTGVPKNYNVWCIMEVYNGTNLSSSGFSLMTGYNNQYRAPYYINEHEQGYEFRYQIMILEDGIRPSDNTTPFLESETYSYHIP